MKMMKRKQSQKRKRMKKVRSKEWPMYQECFC